MSRRKCALAHGNKKIGGFGGYGGYTKQKSEKYQRVLPLPPDGMMSLRVVTQTMEGRYAMNDYLSVRGTRDFARVSPEELNRV